MGPRDDTRSARIAGGGNAGGSPTAEPAVSLVHPMSEDRSPVNASAKRMQRWYEPRVSGRNLRAG
jgi:hypothetical protein